MAASYLIIPDLYSHVNFMSVSIHLDPEAGVCSIHIRVAAAQLFDLLFIVRAHPYTHRQLN
jgi:hypothetical protein